MSNKNKNKTENKSENKNDIISKFANRDVPSSNNLSNKLLLDTIIENIDENTPFFGVNNIANKLAKNNLILTSKKVRVKLQKIRKSSPDYLRRKTGFVILKENNKNPKNPYNQPLVIEWVDNSNRNTGIQYSITKIDESQINDVRKTLKETYKYN